MQLAKLTETMGKTQEQIKKLSTNTKPKRKYFCWRCSRKLKHRIQHFSDKKGGHKYEAHCRDRMGVNNKGCKLRLEEIIDKT